MNKGFGTLFALAAGAFVLGAQVPAANAAPIGNAGIAQSHAKLLVNVASYKRGNYYKKRTFRGRHSRVNRCAHLRRQAIRSGNRWAWKRYNACRFR